MWSRYAGGEPPRREWRPDRFFFTRALRLRLARTTTKTSIAALLAQLKDTDCRLAIRNCRREVVEAVQATRSLSQSRCSRPSAFNNRRRLAGERA